MLLLLLSTTLVLLPPGEGLFGKASDLTPVLFDKANEFIHDGVGFPVACEEGDLSSAERVYMSRLIPVETIV